MSQRSWSIRDLAIAIFASAMLAACGTDTKTEYVQTSAPDSTYLIEYIPGMMPATEGKTEFKLRVAKRSDGSLVTGLTSTGISITPMMYMTGHSHSTPVDTIVNNGDGTYSCTTYYLMPTKMMGMIVGHWEIKVTIGAESTFFYPYVDGTMSTDTVRATLKGQSDDLISSTTGTSFRSYYLFKDGDVTNTSINLFLASGGNLSQSYPAIYSGATLTNYQNTGWTVTSVLVEATTDTLATWQTGTNSAGDGHWLVSGLSLTSSATNTVYLRLSVNGTVKTTDGMVSNASLTNTYATFIATLP